MGVNDVCHNRPDYETALDDFKTRLDHYEKVSFLTVTCRTSIILSRLYRVCLQKLFRLSYRISE